MKDKDVTDAPPGGRRRKRTRPGKLTGRGVRRKELTCGDESKK